MQICALYMSTPFLGLLVLLSAGFLQPAWQLPLSTEASSRLNGSLYCEMDAVFGAGFYRLDLGLRKWAPVLGKRVGGA